jgi:hypothetical protein
MNWDKWLKISWKKLLIIIGLWFIAVILHNAVYAIFGVEDALFFIIAIFILSTYFIISIIYSIITKIKEVKK